MYVEYILPVYTAICIVSLFSGVTYDVGPIVLRPFDAMVLMGGAIITAAASVRGRIRHLRKNSLYYLFLFLYVYRVINGALLTGAGEAVKELIQATEFIVLIHLISITTFTEEKRRKFLRVLLFGFGVSATVVAVWHIGQGSYANYKRLGDPKLLFGAFALLAIGRYMNSGAKESGGVLMAFALLLAILSGERKGWVALAGAVATMYVVMQNVSIRRVFARILRPRVVLAGGVLAVVGIGIALQFEYIERQFASMYDLYIIASKVDLEMDLSQFETSSSNLARLYILLFAVRATLAHPVFGAGTGRWHDALNQMARTDDSRFMIGAHSEYQRFAVENGLTGLFLYVTLWVLAIRRAIHFEKLFPVNQQHSAIIIVGLSVFGAIINLFLGGGALNTIYLALSVGLLTGLENDRALLQHRSKAVDA